MTSPPKWLFGFWLNLVGMILGWSSFKVVSSRTLVAMASEKGETDKTLKSTGPILKLFGTNVPWGTLPRLFKLFWSVGKALPPGGIACFPYKVYNKNVLVLKYWSDLKKIGGTSTKNVQIISICCKTLPPGAEFVFLVCIFSKNFKKSSCPNLLILHKCSLGEPLPLLF